MWKYIIKDDYLSEDKFNSLIDEVKHIKPDGVTIYDDGPFADTVYRKILDYDPTPEIGEMINEFTASEKRLNGPYKKFIHFAVTPANMVHKEHFEAPWKVMSAIIYLAPEKNIGTTLVDYRENPTEKITLDWKPNRMMTFCGLDDITWHYYESIDVRYTYNYFLVDPDFSKMRNKKLIDYVID